MGVLRSTCALAVGWLLIAATARAEPPPEPEPTFVLVPLGETDRALVDHVAESVRRRFTVQVEVAAALPMPKKAWYKPRKRWRAEKLLDALEELDLPGARRVIGLTEQPISTTKGKIFDWGIAGLARMDGRSCVLTAFLFRRLKAKQATTYRRYMENLVLHEVGHTLGLEHCPLDRCIMADAKGNAIRAAKASIDEFCPRCTRLLGHWLRDPTVHGTWSKDERARLLLEDAPHLPR